MSEFKEQDWVEVINNTGCEDKLKKGIYEVLGVGQHGIFINGIEESIKFSRFKLLQKKYYRIIIE
jgi:hypothetical protein